MAVAQYVRMWTKAGAPSANDFAGWPTGARVGDLGVDTTNGKLYICTAATTSTCTWTVVGTQS